MVNFLVLFIVSQIFASSSNIAIDEVGSRLVSQDYPLMAIAHNCLERGEDRNCLKSEIVGIKLDIDGQVEAVIKSENIFDREYVLINDEDFSKNIKHMLYENSLETGFYMNFYNMTRRGYHVQKSGDSAGFFLMLAGVPIGTLLLPIDFVVGLAQWHPFQRAKVKRFLKSANSSQTSQDINVKQDTFLEFFWEALDVGPERY